jgi:acyl-[acyl-carrier-protein]-phospholipid O-acyltransferase/long-chain-fatty-acid--[acyl-carrier-protein] ligase
MFFPLLISRRFGWLFSTMVLGAFNDNYYKNALIILITYVLAKNLSMPAESLISIAAASFILPFFLFSGFAGMLADKFAKHRIIRVLKITELIIICAAAVALWWEHVGALMFLLFMLGTQAAFLGPAKYAILPELLDEKELLAGNGMVEGGTFVSILLGTIFGGLLVLHPHGTLIVGASMIAMSALGVVTGWRVPATRAAVPDLKIPHNPFASMWEMVRAVWQHPGVLKPIIGISWFWAIGAVYLTQIPVFTKEVVGGDEEVVTWFMSLFSIGIAAGSVACQSIIRRVHLRHIVSWSLFGVCLFGLDLVWAGYAMPKPEALVGLRDYLDGFTHLRISLALFLMAFCGGVFTIPLYTRLQLASGTAQRARAVASNNVMNALFIAGASLLAAALYGMHWTVCDVLLLFSLANIPVILLLWRRAV